MEGTVVCTRCALVVPANQAEYTAQGALLCRTCAHEADVANMLGAKVGAGRDAVAAAERSLERAKHMKHVIIGGIALAVGIPLGIYLWKLWDEGRKSQGTWVPWILIVIGVVEVARGIAGLVKKK